MDDDQQFCLRWNNHQSTLVAVFDTLLENGTLVDCTLAAEGKCLNAHKVVLSACSPYFEALLSKHFDKHPILILKDVKFQELKAMMDYMYRGEVNISQDQLGALLKAAESLQIKGLSDNRKGETERKPAPAPPPPKSPQPASTLPKVQGLTIEQRARDDSREGSISPGPRKKKRLRRKSEELDNHDASNSSESHSLPAQNIPTLPAVTKMNADVPEQVETKSEILTRHKQTDEMPQVPIIKEKIETHTELMLEPKSEYVDEMNEDSIEDLTLDDDDLSNMEQMDDGAGPSHGNTGEGSSQGFGGWHMGNQSQDEVFLAAQEAVGAHRDSQGKTITRSTQTRVIKMVDRSTQRGERKDKKHSLSKSEKTDLKVIKKKKVLSILKKKKHVIKSFLDGEAEKLQKETAIQNMFSKEAKIVLKTPKINRAMRSRSNSVKSEPGNLSNTLSAAASTSTTTFCSYNKPYNYGRSCEACILLKESGKYACPGCQKKSTILNEPPNKAYNYGKTCEACILLKEQGKPACPGCQARFILSVYNYGKNCDICNLLKEKGKYACGRCQKMPDKTKKKKSGDGGNKKSHKKNKKKKTSSVASEASSRLNNQATGENNNEENVEYDDGIDDEFIEYVSLRDLLNNSEK